MQDNLYILPEYSHPHEKCQKCLCMMCVDFYIGGCRSCPFCYYLEDATGVKFCNCFVPFHVDLQIREWYSRDTVITDPNFNTVFP